MDAAIGRYVKKALSKENRKAFDGDSNAKYRVQIMMAEIGPDGRGGEAGFLFEIKIPRQVDNSLGLSCVQVVQTREEAAAILEELIAELKRQ